MLSHTLAEPADHTALTRAGYVFSEHIRLVRAGHEFFDLLDELIGKAKSVIHLQTYIFDEDETGLRVARALMEAAQRKVSVYVVVDGYASQSLSDDFVVRMKRAGVHFRFFAPLLKSREFYFGRRLHHKVVVVDGRHSLVGGINIGNHYNDTPHNVAWLDWALYTEGNVGLLLNRICEVRIYGGFMTAMRRTMNRAAKEEPEHAGKYPVRPRINDWVRSKRQVTASYLEMLNKSQSHIYIISSYFIPGQVLRKHLSRAAKRGVRIKVILAGITDVQLAKHAERYMYRWLLRNRIEIYEYQRKVLHAKLATYDGKWVTVGSYNVNNISAYASVELNMDVHDESFALDVEAKLNRILSNECVQITEEMYAKRSNLWSRFIQRSAYDIFRVLLFIFTFYFKQRD
jgi:cardiolipin synthase